ncbi:hypothetical protein MMC15_001810, partial [Xylographa vitiligo]|nr:hypothetical protein [Xylographa vitiligo]
SAVLDLEPTEPITRTQQALDVAGPSAFNLDTHLKLDYDIYSCAVEGNGFTLPPT